MNRRQGGLLAETPNPRQPHGFFFTLRLRWRADMPTLSAIGEPPLRGLPLHAARGAVVLVVPEVPISHVHVAHVPKGFG